jgi:molecular chaperone DnaK
MKNYLGIDLGTTNSVICVFDGEQTKIYQSPEQSDVTPSAIYFTKTGTKLYGKTAYEKLPYDPLNVAIGFKRFMGSQTNVNIPNLDKTLTPVECSADILKTLFKYLPDHIQNDPEVGVVITVPAAFNQMQKDATLEAANNIGIERVSLIQEPIAAILSVLKTTACDGAFLVYDLGGGTFDISIAVSTRGNVNLLNQGGIQVCGGKDFDSLIAEKVIYPWLTSNFNLPREFYNDQKYAKLVMLCKFAAEKAKIRLSSMSQTSIYMTENEVNLTDLSHREICLDVPLDQRAYDTIISEKVADTIKAVEETLSAVSMRASDIKFIVFVGGPPCYKPLRDKVSSALGIPVIPSNVNPMTAVAEGAAIYAETIDWTTDKKSRKNIRGSMNSGGALNLKFEFIARTTFPRTKLKINLPSDIGKKYEFQVDNIDTGWTTGRMELYDKVVVDLDLSKMGDNNFKIFVFNQYGELVSIEQNKLVITKTFSNVESIPAPFSISIEVLDPTTGNSKLDYLVKKGDLLPKTGDRVFRSGINLRAGGSDSLRFRMWQGDISHPIHDNRWVGTFKICGTDFDSGMISTGETINFSYEMSDDGNIKFSVSIPTIQFRSANNSFYSRHEGQRDYFAEHEYIKGEAILTLQRVDKMAEKISDIAIATMRRKLNEVISLPLTKIDAEKIKEAEEIILDVKKEIDNLRKKHLLAIRQRELDSVIARFDANIRPGAKDIDIANFESIVATAKKNISIDNADFETNISSLEAVIRKITSSKPDWIINEFHKCGRNPHWFKDMVAFNYLIKCGEQALAENDMNRLRSILSDIWELQIPDDKPVSTTPTTTTVSTKPTINTTPQTPKKESFLDEKVNIVSS